MCASPSNPRLRPTIANCGSVNTTDIGVVRGNVWMLRNAPSAGATWRRIPFGKATLTLGGTAYLYPSARPSFGEPDSTWELSAGVSGPLVGVLSWTGRESGAGEYQETHTAA